MHYLFTTWEGGGNVTPAMEVARKLIVSGHRVTVLSEECNRNEAKAVGASFVAWNRAPSRKDRSRESQTFNDWAAATPQEGLLTVIRDVWCGPALAYAQDVVEQLQTEPVDLVVTCEALFGVMAGCQSVGQKFAIFSPNISLAPLPGVPPLGPGLAPARSDEERAMHAEIRVGVQAMMDSGLPALNAARATLGLRPLDHVLDQLQGAVVELLGTSPAFDFPADNLPVRLRYVGPQISDPKWAQPWSSPWAKSDPRRLVVVSFSTTFQNHTAVLQNVLDALEPLPVRVLVTLGGPIRPDELRPTANSLVLESAPHGQVMPEAALVVTHGGHGTVMRGLLSRVPMLILPHGRDQNDNAVRVSERGAGLCLPANATVEAIRAACHSLLEDPKFSLAARQLGDAVTAHAESSTVVQELETAASSA